MRPGGVSTVVTKKNGCPSWVSGRARHWLQAGRGFFTLTDCKRGQNLFLGGTSIRRGMGFLPQTQVLKNFLDDRTLVDEADDVHFAGALGADKRICFVHLSDEVRPALF